MTPSEAVDTLVSWLSRKGMKVTRQRRLITEVFYDPAFSESHPTVEEMYLRVRDVDTSVGYATVYRTLKLLVDCDLALPNRLGDNQTRYEPHGDDHHDHLVCLECGAILEFEDEAIERLQRTVARRLGFELADHRMVLYGTPRECPAELCRRGEA